MISQYIQYFVEGEDEETLINVLKTDMRMIRAGKVQKFNVVEQTITDARLMLLRPKTLVVLVFDTDTGRVETLSKNLEILHKCPSVTEIVTIPQNLNLEQELVRSCDIRDIKQLLGSKSKKDFKSDLIRSKNLAHKLNEHHFDIDKFWRCEPPISYHGIQNLSHRIKQVR